MQEEVFIKVYICPICGKEFIPAPYHRYNVLVGERRQLVCSYSCTIKGEEEHEKALKQKRRPR